MNSKKSRIFKIIKKCWKEISFKDKGLIFIMGILLAQCIYSLYSPEPTNPDYVTINVIVRTGVASIFGYFFSANFLSKAKKNKNDESYKFKVFGQLSQNKQERNEDELNIHVNSEVEETQIEEDKEIYFCNKTLQNAIAIILCVITLISLIVGMNLDIISKNSTASISQFRDLISGCIGFLLGNSVREEKE